MSFSISVLEILLAAFDMVFNFWFFIILFPLQKRKSGIRDFIYVWIFLAVIRFFLFGNPYPSIKSFFLPEPINTILFFGTGFVLISIWLSRNYLTSRKLRIKAWGLSVQDLINLPPGEFEEMTAELYRARGHKAWKTGASGDHGVDVVVKSKEGRTMIIQCKRWRRPVGEPVVREFYGTMQHEKAGYGTIFATYGFTQQAIEWAKGKPLALYNGEKFISMWQKSKEANGN